MKIHISNMSKQNVGGGWTFIRNFKKGLKDRVYFVDSWKEADIIFIAGISMINKHEIYEAVKDGKKLILRVDNVPKKSRSKRQTPHQRLKEFAEISDVVVYQSKWAREYCKPLCGDGLVIYNGVDDKVFYPAKEKPKNDRYLFAYHGKSELKCFWQAHHYYQWHYRDNPNSEFWFIYDFGKELDNLKDANFDFWQGEKFKHLPRQESDEAMATIMRQCTHLIFPSFADASPNTVTEALACGLKVVNTSDVGGTRELLEDEFDYSLEKMADEYYNLFKFVLNN